MCNEFVWGGGGGNLSGPVSAIQVSQAPTIDTNERNFRSVLIMMLSVPSHSKSLFSSICGGPRALEDK